MPDYIVLILGVVGVIVIFEFGVSQLEKTEEGKGRWIAILVICAAFALGVLLDHFY